MAKKIRMLDIAQALGISVVSVSKALAGKEGVSDKMRAQILETARQMGYVPVSQEKQQNRTIGVLVSDRFFADNTFYNNLYRQISLCCSRSGCTALLEIVSVEAEQNCITASVLQAGQVDGLIFLGQFSRAYLEASLEGSLPFLLLDFYVEHFPASAVLADNISGACSLTEHLLHSGRKTVGFVGSYLATTSLMDRLLGYTRAILKNGGTLRMDWILEDRDKDGAFIPLQLPEELPDAFVCGCDEAAYNLIRTLQARGLRVPEDVAVAGYNDDRFAILSNPPLTTYRISPEAMAKEAVRRLLRLIDGRPDKHENKVVPGELMIRRST